MKPDTIKFIQRLLENELKAEYVYDQKSEYQEQLIKASLDFVKNHGNAVDMMYVKELTEQLL